MISIRTRFANIVAATSIGIAAVTAGPAPAAAKDDELLKALAGIAAVAVFSGLLNQPQQNQPVTRTQPLSLLPGLPVFRDQPRTDPLYDGIPWRDEVSGVRGGPRLPAACALEFGNGPSPATYYTESCLRREGVAFALPQYCAQRIRGRDYQGQVYEADCLRDAGYRTERWR